MKINARMYREGAAVYYSEGFHRLVETHLNWLKNSNLLLENVEPATGYKYESDLFGLLQHLKVVPEYHWVVMRLNDYTSPTDYRSDRLQLLIPHPETMEKLRQLYASAAKKIIT